MKNFTKHKALAVILGLAFTATAHAVVIISDTFAGTTDGASIAGRTLETSLSGGNWQTFGVNTVSFHATATAGFGNPLNGTFGFNGQSVSAVSITSAGAFVKPTVLTISADLVTSPTGFTGTVGSASGGRGMALGFYSSPSGPTDFSQNLFTGLVIDNLGNLNLVSDPNAAGFFGGGSFLGTPIAYVGTWDASAMHRLSYTVDTTTGAISGISLGGSTASYAFTTNLFTNSATALAGVYLSSESGATLAGMDNFKVEGIPEPSTTLLGGLGVLALLRRRRA